MDIVAQNDNSFRQSDEVEANSIVSERDVFYQSYENHIYNIYSLSQLLVRPYSGVYERKRGIIMAYNLS